MIDGLLTSATLTNGDAPCHLSRVKHGNAVLFVPVFFSADRLDLTAKTILRAFDRVLLGIRNSSKSKAIQANQWLSSVNSCNCFRVNPRFGLPICSDRRDLHGVPCETGYNWVALLSIAAHVSNLSTCIHLHDSNAVVCGLWVHYRLVHAFRVGQLEGFKSLVLSQPLSKS